MTANHSQPVAVPIAAAPPQARGDVPEPARVPGPARAPAARGIVVAGHAWRFGSRSPGAPSPGAPTLSADSPGERGSESPAPALPDDPRALARGAARLVADTLLANLTLVVSLVVVAGVALAGVVTLLMGQVPLALALGAVSLLAVAIAIEPARSAGAGELEAGAPVSTGAAAGGSAEQPVEVEHSAPVVARAA